MTELQVLQYRTAYINVTPIVSNQVDQRLRLVTAALLRKDEIQSGLEFLIGDRNSVWPSKNFGT